jgi:hypothetical protein
MASYCGELPHTVYSPAVFPTSKRRDTTPRTLRGKTLSSDSMEILPSEFRAIFSYCPIIHIKREREGKQESPLLALLERGREDPCSYQSDSDQSFSSLQDIVLHRRCATQTPVLFGHRDSFR